MSLEEPRHLLDGLKEVNPRIFDLTPQHADLFGDILSGCDDGQILGQPATDLAERTVSLRRGKVFDLPVNFSLRHATTASLG